MALPAIQAEYAEDAADFIAEMRENGHQASFGVRSNVGTVGRPSAEYVETGTAHVFPSEWQQDFSSDVLAEDLMFFVGAELDISQCTVMLDNDHEYTIQEVKPFKPDGQVIFYEIQVRV